MLHAAGADTDWNKLFDSSIYKTSNSFQVYLLLLYVCVFEQYFCVFLVLPMSVCQLSVLCRRL